MKTFQNDWHERKNTINLLPYKQQALYAIDCALLALPAWQKAYPDDKRPENAINLALKSITEGNVNKEELKKACNAAEACLANNRFALGDVSGQPRCAGLAAYHTAKSAYLIYHLSRYVANEAANSTEYAAQVITWQLIIELFDQADQPFNPRYRTSDTEGLAEDIVQGNFHLMPVLADALTDLDCPEDQVNMVRNSKAYSNWALYHLGVDCSHKLI